MNLVRRGRRKALTPILAEVILIAVTLIAGVAISGWVFGLMGTLASPATVFVNSVSCSSTSCTIGLTNSGVASTNPTGSGVIDFAGTVGTLSCAPVNPVVGGGGVATLTCSITSLTLPVATQAYSGSIGLSNGGQVEFAGRFMP